MKVHRFPCCTQCHFLLIGFPAELSKQTTLIFGSSFILLFPPHRQYLVVVSPREFFLKAVHTRHELHSSPVWTPIPFLLAHDARSVGLVLLRLLAPVFIFCVMCVHGAERWWTGSWRRCV